MFNFVGQSVFRFRETMFLRCGYFLFSRVTCIRAYSSSGVSVNLAPILKIPNSLDALGLVV